MTTPRLDTSAHATHDVWNQRGCDHCDAQRYDDAIAAFDQAIALNSHYCPAWNNRGVALAQQQRYAESLAAYDRAIALQPHYHQAWYNRGLLFVTMMAYGNALESFDRAISLYPDAAYLDASQRIYGDGKLIAA